LVAARELLVDAIKLLQRLPIFGGGGMPQRMVVSSRPVSVLRTTGAG
jgi:hypothetical protein